MSLRGNCSVCEGANKSHIQDFVIRVALRDQPEHPISGLRAYRCEEDPHIFFVMA